MKEINCKLKNCILRAPQKQVGGNKMDCLSFFPFFFSFPPARRWNPDCVCCSSWQKQWFRASNVW